MSTLFETSMQKKRHRKIAPLRKPQPKPHDIQLYPIETVRSNKILLEEQPQPSVPPFNLPSKSSDPSIIETKRQDDKALCSMRAAVTTFLIVVLIVFAAGIAIGVTFALMNAKNSSGSGNGSSGGSSNQDAFSTVPSGILTSSVSVGSQTGLPCSSYTQINDPTRNINFTTSYGFCDNSVLFNASNGGAWIRFVGTGGTQIPLSSPGLNHCGAFLSGWYNGSLPTTMSVATPGTVCFETYTDVCAFPITVSVVYCPSNYYVYFLPPISTCSARYCTT